MPVRKRGQKAVTKVLQLRFLDRLLNNLKDISKERDRFLVKSAKVCVIRLKNRSTTVLNL